MVGEKLEDITAFRIEFEHAIHDCFRSFYEELKSGRPRFQNEDADGRFLCVKSLLFEHVIFEHLHDIGA